jgi:hypothetical protein
MLLALTAAGRASEIIALDLNFMQDHRDRIVSLSRNSPRPEEWTANPTLSTSTNSWNNHFLT